MSKLTLNIISQEQHLLTAEVDQITAPAASGEVTILPSHIPLFTKLNDGVIVIKIDNQIDEFAVLGGFMDVGPDNQVTILADAAIRADDINIAQAEAARHKAELAMKNKVSEINFKEAEVSLRKALLELKVASKHRPRPQLSTHE